jgi:hypothetical protein
VRRRGMVTLAVVVATVSTFALAGRVPAGATAPLSVGPVTTISAPCQGTSDEVEQAVDPSGSGYVYEAWAGCEGIGFARSTDAGASFSPAVTLAGSLNSPGDPDVAVAPDGTVYISFMMFRGGQNYPVVDASFDHGVTFPQVTALIPPELKNWGDSPNIAVGPDGTVYLTWGYGPHGGSVVTHCTTGGSCAYLKGDLNVVVQTSTDEGKTFGPMVPIGAGYPWSGADNGPIVVDPTGRVDVLFQDYPTNAKTHALSPALNYFTSSDDEGATWSSPVAVGPQVGTTSMTEWWNEPSLGIDAGGNLYAAWDTQGKSSRGAHTDTGWLSYSKDQGATWSPPVQAPADVENVPHIMQVTGAAAGEADVGWLSDSDSQGYALSLRPYSIASGWLGQPFQVSTSYGAKTVWPGDTFGLSIVDPTHIVMSWGSAVATDGQPPPYSSVYAAQVTSAG